MSQAPVTDATHDILRPAFRSLAPIFAPRSVVVIGASDRPGDVGAAVLANLGDARFRGSVFAIHPDAPTIGGYPAFPTLGAVPAPIDLAVIAVPAAALPQVVDECVTVGVGGALILATGFREAGAAAAALEQQVLQVARRGRMPLLGPHSLGVMRPRHALNASYARGAARSGNVAFVSQSGALGAAILDWSQAEHVGFSAFVSIGGMLDVGWADLIDYLGDDPETQSIMLYMETVGDARAFLSAAREVALTKPIIVLKTGRTAGAVQATMSHTGSLAGSDAVFDAALRRCGVLRVETIAELFYMAEALAKQARPRGPRLTILSNAGGPGVLAADALLRSGGQLAPLPPATVAALDRALPPFWSQGNPINMLGDADAARYAQALAIAADNPESDGLLVILTPQPGTDPAACAATLEPYARRGQKPLLASWIGGPAARDGEAILNRMAVPTFPYPDTAARIFAAMWRYSQTLHSLYETPVLPRAVQEADRSRATTHLAAAQQRGDTFLDELASKKLLTDYGIPVAAARFAGDEDTAVALADELGYPVVLKVVARAAVHKSAVGGVHLDLADAQAVRLAFRSIQSAAAAALGAGQFRGVAVQPMVRDVGVELLLGSSLDPDFGPVLLFGAGGQLAEVLDDRALALPPLTTTLARRMMEQTRVWGALKGVPGRPPVDLAALEHVLVRFSHLIVEQPRIRELDINPLLVTSHRCVALDARVLLHGPELDDTRLPRTAIRPYPSQYLARLQLKDGSSATIRPIRPEDEPLMVQFHGTLSERSVYLRYFAPLALSRRTAHDRLTRMCFIDYDREMALVVVRDDPQLAESAIVAVGRLIKLRGKNEAEFAILVSDQFQGFGLGTELLRRLLAVGRDEGVARIVAEILPENRGMQRVAEKLGFKLRRIPGEQIVLAALDLADPPNRG